MQNDPGAVWEAGVLRSARFGDVYASRQGALAQSRAVFLGGCGLPQRWAGRRRFTVGELGFGTGLNMLALLQLWQQHRPEGATLHLFSIDGFPLAAADARRALEPFPELAQIATPLLAGWPKGARGLHRIRWPELGATLDLMVGDVGEALAGWDGKADAWFLDGFSPAKNPEMWSEALLAQVAAHTAPGGRAATWSVAGAVRRGLEAGGFDVSRQPGFGHKSERLEARFPGVAAEPPQPRVAIIGAGIAGASLARAFADFGLTAHIFAQGPMASGNPAALVTPRLAAGSGDGAALHALAFRRAVQRIRESAPEAIIAQGVRRLLSESETARAVATVESGLFDAGSLTLDGDGMRMAEALVVSPDRLRAAWLPAVEERRVEALPEGFDILVVAAGIESAALAGVHLRAVRGQASFADLPMEAPPTSWGGYLIPTDTGLLFGATHDRGDTGWEVRDADNARNLEGLARRFPRLAARLAETPLSAAAGVRAATGDHQPLAGEVRAGLFVLTGLGGRGFTLAPLLAEHVAAQALSLPSPLSLPMQRLVSPARAGVAGAALSSPSAAAPAAA
ncbi:tRNA (5-methylaminomethyl-2-thiouridine)(34)-methyltransferase MnmD [Sandaracinobacteroides hominis]|uniref:tRNA (5-methylaminomethyl-2-thiouridine)(34)-methyltransferase MnmD n=1 Tax=Sandaracinobacteroides hominis TaxID=2780086 RepID=UPI0018F6EC30|nr:tRNA (5-methylaminomethyl-2-thiouridine)(34)-methyltransferase MnmD [Sandaracinobacteroides hominis]